MNNPGKAGRVKAPQADWDAARPLETATLPDQAAAVAAAAAAAAAVSRTDKVAGLVMGPCELSSSHRYSLLVQLFLATAVYLTLSRDPSFD